MRAGQIVVVSQFWARFQRPNAIGGIYAVKQESDDQTGKNGKSQGIEGFLKALFTTQKFAVLATQKDGQPYTNLVASASTEDCKHLLFVTPRATRKFANLASDALIAKGDYDSAGFGGITFNVRF